MSSLESEQSREQGRSGEAARVGADLRAARLRLGWDLAAIANGLRIRLVHLQALEDGRVADLPGNAYALGFLRSYARALGLDADEMTRRFRAEAVGVNRKTILHFPVPVPERGVPAGALVLLGVVLVVAAYGGWYRFSGRMLSGPDAAQLVLQQSVPPLPGHLAGQATASPQIASMQPAALVPPVPTPPLAAPAPVTAPAAPPVASPYALPLVPPSQAAAAPLPPPVDLPHWQVRASADSWLQVRDGSGLVLLNRVLHAGESWAAPDARRLVLITGNAGGTILVHDGVASAPLGAAGAVLRDVPLGDVPLGNAPPGDAPVGNAAPDPSTNRGAAQ